MPTKRPQHAESVALKRMEQSVPSSDIKAVLAVSSDPRAVHLLDLMMDPEYFKWNLPALCAKAGLYYEDVLLMLTRGRVGEGMEKMSRHAPKVFDDIGIEAESNFVPCPECRGKGEMKVGKGKQAERIECWVCEGSKKIRKPGDVDSRSFMLQALQVINKGKGTNVQVNVGNTGVNSVEDDLNLTGEVIDVSVAQQPE